MIFFINIVWKNAVFRRFGTSSQKKYSYQIPLHCQLGLTWVIELRVERFISLEVKSNWSVLGGSFKLGFNFPAQFKSLHISYSKINVNFLKFSIQGTFQVWLWMFKEKLRKPYLNEYNWVKWVLKKHLLPLNFYYNQIALYSVLFCLFEIEYCSI